MRKIWNKIENNKILFSLFLFFVLFIFMLITSGLNGAIINGWYGITHIIVKLSEETSAGQSIFGEITWALFLIPIILLFKNRYIFSEKRMSFKETIKIIWPMLLMITALMISGLSEGNAFTNFNAKEFLAIIILCTFVGVFEEILCRGWLQNELIERFGKTRKDIIFSIVISGLLFGLIHIINYFAGADLAGTIIQIISAVIFGIYLGSIYYKTKNIWVAIFLHGFWDFALFMSSMNETSTCVEISVLPSIGIGILAMFMLDLPGILTALRILEKVNLEKTINPKAKFTKEEIEKSEKFNSKVKTFQISFVSILGIIFVFGGLMSAFDKPTDVCMNYEKVSINNYSFTELGYTDYDIIVDEHILNIKASNEKLIIIDKLTSNSVEVDIPNLDSFAVINKDNKSIIMALGRPQEYYMVYYSDFINIGVTNNNNYLEELKKSFKTLELPEIISFGYYTSSDSIIYPWFKTRYNTYYIKDDKTIKQLIIE